MRDIELEIAERFNIVDVVKKIECDLINISEVLEVEFDLSGFYDNMDEIIILTKYDIPVNLKNYYEIRNKLIQQVLQVAYENNLVRTGDSIEDYGSHLYFVFSLQERKKLTEGKQHG